MQKIVAGILAHVDAGKTTLSEAMLYESGAIRKMGRVDNRDAFLDTYEVERNRGITVFSKQAVFTLPDVQITLLDTPGHVDFSAEMERTLQVLDYAVLVISGADGVQGHTRTLWRLLNRYRIPVFLFINKMDQPGTDREALMRELKENLSGNCVDFTKIGKAQWGGDIPEEIADELAMCSEAALEQFLESGTIELSLIKQMIKTRQTFPCFFGSALKMEGVKEFMEGVETYAIPSDYSADFGARVFKISRDAQGNRLTYMKITGGVLKARDVLKGTYRNADGDLEEWEEKVNQIRIYSGEKFEAVSEVGAGSVCAVTGLEKTRPGEGLGIEKEEVLPLLEPVLNYRIILPEEIDAAVMLPKLREIEEEEPQLQIEWNEKLQEIHAKVMGEVQIEILQGEIFDRFGVNVTFGSGNIVYKETIADVVEGVGHFEPLRHYAEVHLIMEPLERGSGLQFESAVSEDELDRNWQRLILTHLEEKQHKGVLTGSDITDMKITLAAGRAHLKHTEGGDFRQSTYRAVRQGLMQARSVLLEPYYEFRMELPERYIGRAMTDVERLFGKCELTSSVDGMAVLCGKGPVQTMWNYQKEVTAYTRGEGHFFGELGGYEPCHNTEEVLEQIGYDCDSDMSNPSGSVFCAHGAGFVVPWDEVHDYMHLEKRLGMRGSKWTKYGILTGEESSEGAYITMPDEIDANYARRPAPVNPKSQEIWLGTEEIDAILDRTYNANRRENERNNKWAKTKAAPQLPSVRTYSPTVKKPQYLLVDGYNIIFAWDDLKELANVTIDGARGKLLDILCNYQGIKNCELIVVFDAYRVQGHQTEILDYHNIHVVYTKEAETADQYIEKFAHENGRKYDVTVATSDGLEQIIIRGQGCRLLSARELREEIDRVENTVQKDYLERQVKGKNLLGESMPKMN
ncbi:MAG: TetM/TetW/TetO/TetS family tetracycline resistance ribosomal protection protein [Lachnospiraceae bacterium]|nr:TetM/TetW/TetO/TetS family tetracycline resistance ribosomal protection protein [Lachnospiraceae bacterium]